MTMITFPFLLTKSVMLIQELKYIVYAIIRYKVYQICLQFWRGFFSLKVITNYFGF